MNNYLAVQIGCCTLLVLMGFCLLWQYQKKVSHRAELQTYQYQLFALRDRVIRLVAEETTSEDDPHWRTLYRHVNESARLVNVSRMRNGFTFVLSLLKNASPPGTKELEEFQQLPKALQEIWMHYVATILFICLRGSFALRTLLSIASHVGCIQKWLERSKPEESRNYRRWKVSEARFSAPCGAGV